MHGNGNDFVLLDLREQSFDLGEERVRMIADRHRGVGFDQLLVLQPADSAGALARIEIWNSDGSRAEQCGNGMRCIGEYLRRRGDAGDQPFNVIGPVDTIRMTCVAPGQVSVDMGLPRFEPAQVPTSLSPADGEYHLQVDGSDHRFGAVSMGNPHAVFRVDHVATAPVAGEGSATRRGSSSTAPAFSGAPGGTALRAASSLSGRPMRAATEVTVSPRRATATW